MMTLLPLMLALSLPPLQGSTEALQAPERPRLVVVVALENLLPRQLERLAPDLSGGLARFLGRGRVHLAAELGQARSEAAPGFASAATGVRPRRHGVSGNALRDPDGSERRRATSDQGVETLGPGGLIPGREAGGFSPRDLRAPTLGDHLLAAEPEARVVAIGGLGVGSVLLGGEGASWALGWDTRVGGFTSSTYYGEALPDWVLAWNAGWLEQASGFAFEATLADPLVRGFGPDARDGETPSSNEGGLLPFSLPVCDANSEPLAVNSLARSCVATPLIDRFVVDLALEALGAMELGADGTPDLLLLAPSALGESVRRAGPFSVEAAETILALDRELGRLFDALDERLGPDGWVAALASTSGAMELPEALKTRGVEAQRLASVQTRRDLAAVRAALEAHFGVYIGATLSPVELDLDDRVLIEAELDASEARAVARDALVAAADWVAAGYTREELASEEPVDDAFLELYRRSYPPGAGPDVALRLEPWVLGGQRFGSNSGSPYPWDRAIVLAILGAGVEPETSYAPAALTDLAPTLAALLRLTLDSGTFDGSALR